MTGPSNYDKAPSVNVPGHACDVGWDAIAARLGGVVAVECYPGVDDLEIIRQLERRLLPALVVRASGALRPQTPSTGWSSRSWAATIPSSGS